MLCVNSPDREVRATSAILSLLRFVNSYSGCCVCATIVCCWQAYAIKSPFVFFLWLTAYRLPVERKRVRFPSLHSFALLHSKSGDFVSFWREKSSFLLIYFFSIIKCLFWGAFSTCQLRPSPIRYYQDKEFRKYI